jgi:hypothetical protein
MQCENDDHDRFKKLLKYHINVFVFFVVICFLTHVVGLTANELTITSFVQLDVILIIVQDEQNIECMRKIMIIPAFDFR